MQWRTSAYGGYAAVSYGSLGNSILCVAEGQGAGAGTAAVATAGCNNNWSNWWLGSRTQWNVTPDTYLGLDVSYQRLQSASSATGLVPAANIPATTGTTAIATKDEGAWSFRFRVHKDFYP